MSNDDKVYTHESYGQVSFSRIQSTGGRRLYGSSLASHLTTVRLRIARSGRRHGLSQDWFHERERIVEVELSAAQFAELLTTMNAGAGVPCTIVSLGRDRMEEPPPVETEAEAVRTGFHEDMARIVAETKAWRAEVMTALDGAKGITKATRDLVTKGVDRVVQHLAANAPFVVESFQEASARVVSAAKAEVDAFMLHNVIQAGLAHVRGLNAAQPDDGRHVIDTNLLGTGKDGAP